MPLYMVQFAYTSDAWAALVDTQEDRSVAIASVAATMGSRMVCYYLTFGESWSLSRPGTSRQLRLRRC
jgi:uncharacterized protein with GYD domain